MCREPDDRYVCKIESETPLSLITGADLKQSAAESVETRFVGWAT